MTRLRGPTDDLDDDTGDRFAVTIDGVRQIAERRDLVVQASPMATEYTAERNTPPSPAPPFHLNAALSAIDRRRLGERAKPNVNCDSTEGDHR